MSNCTSMAIVLTGSYLLFIISAMCKSYGLPVSCPSVKSSYKSLSSSKRYSHLHQKGEEVKVEEVALNEIDQKFMNDALAAVEKNMDNEEYDIDAFASDVCMSRSTLYRKIISLTGQKPSEFIRTIRLKHAARLIKEGKHSLTEIGYMCGFSSTSYFYRCFKKQYGVQPGCYQ